MKGQSGHDGIAYCLCVDDGHDAGHAHTDRADMGIGGGIRVAGATGAEHLTACEQLRMDLKANDNLEFCSVGCISCSHNFALPLSLSRLVRGDSTQKRLSVWGTG